MKTLHSWLGVLILPWILLIGLTGLFLNHSKLVNNALSGADYDEAQFDEWPTPKQQGVADVIGLAGLVWPDRNSLEVERTEYHGRNALSVSFGRDMLIVDHETGHYWVKTVFRRSAFDPNGTLLHSKIIGGRCLKQFMNMDGLTVVSEHGWPILQPQQWSCSG